MPDRKQELRLALRDLRHLYEQMIAGHVKQEHMTGAANGLLSRAIKRIEKVADSDD